MKRGLTFSKTYINEVIEICNKISINDIEDIVKLILKIKKNKGRIFFLGVGGSAANASHAVNDFRKIVNVESYTPTDNISELTAITNDDGWEFTFSRWLITSKLNKKDMLFILSVGGGDKSKKISVNIIKAIDLAIKRKSKIVGIVGNKGYTAKKGHKVLMIPKINSKHITPHSESFQSVIWHLIVSHPALKERGTKWESVLKGSREKF